jgi:hypothetical protein
MTFLGPSSLFSERVLYDCYLSILAVWLLKEKRSEEFRCSLNILMHETTFRSGSCVLQMAIPKVLTSECSSILIQIEICE